MPGPQGVDISSFVMGQKTSQESLEACQKLAQNLMETSCLIIKDPRVSEEDNNRFLDMMERYYDQPQEIKMKDVHPELSYQLGATPAFTEVPRDHMDKIKALSPENSAHLPKGPDPKWRFFWRIGERPASTQFPELNAPAVVPHAFPEWEKVMDKWGKLMLDSVRIVAEMVAIGLGLEPQTFLDLLDQGPHLLAPTGSDLKSYHNLGDIFAGYHYDLNFLTIHGKSRYPGLFIWLRDGTRHLVRVPDGCLLLQAGKQMEWLTGGLITAGFHEVVVTPETLEAVEKNKKSNRPLWRVSSTLFSHIASDRVLKPLEKFGTEEALQQYPPILAGMQVNDELSKIKLAM